MRADDLPPPLPPPDPLAGEHAELLREPLASLWQIPPAHSPRLRERLLDRVGRSARASRVFFTVRRHDAPVATPADGVRVGLLYESSGPSLRAGEPGRVRWVELAPGARWHPDIVAGARSEWLLISGDADLDGVRLSAHDFHAAPPGLAPRRLCSSSGARLHLREALDHAQAPASTVRAALSSWDEYAPGIRRRVLWCQGGQAAMLYHAQPGAAVPHHGHGLDEECLMLDGDIFLDDVLLRSGDYQLAPAGTEHGGVSTDTGGLLYAHGDLDLELRAD